jgi:hypothetical protein
MKYAQGYVGLDPAGVLLEDLSVFVSTEVCIERAVLDPTQLTVRHKSRQFDALASFDPFPRRVEPRAARESGDY